MPYQIHHLKSNLIFITWTRNPDDEEALRFINDIRQLLAEAKQPLYFISDVRRGRIMNVRIINQLSRLTEHRLWGGSTAFSANPISRIFVSNFQKMSVDHSERNTFFDEPEKALAFLESLLPGLTEEVDWNKLINGANPAKQT